MKRTAKGRRRRAANRARRKRARLWPIRVLLDDLLGLLKGISPEKAEFLQGELDRLGATINIENTEEPFHFFADTTGGVNRIRVGTGSVGRLWASGYGYFCIYTKVAAEKRADLGRQDIDLTSDQRTATGGRLLSWTVNTEMEIADAIAEKKPLQPQLWPVGLPRPKRRVVYGSDAHVADELFLCAAAFILHHELAHLRLGHRKSGSSVRNRKIEEEADAAAAEWILDGIEPRGDRYRKRALGVALALGWLASMGLYVAEDQEHHPPSYDRLATILGRFVRDPNDLIWAFVGVMLRANLEAAKIPVDKSREAKSFKDDVDYCLSLFKKNQWRGKLSKGHVHRT